MVNAQVGDVVKVDLDVKLDDGTVVVTSRYREPITFQIGAGEVIRGIDNASSSAGEFHPHALTEPDVNLSAHPALIVQPANEGTASEQTTPPDETQCRRASGTLCAGVP